MFDPSPSPKTPKNAQKRPKLQKTPKNWTFLAGFKNVLFCLCVWRFLKKIITSTLRLCSKNILMVQKNVTENLFLHRSKNPVFWTFFIWRFFVSCPFLATTNTTNVIQNDTNIRRSHLTRMIYRLHHGRLSQKTTNVSNNGRKTIHCRTYHFYLFFQNKR